MVQMHVAESKQSRQAAHAHSWAKHDVRGRGECVAVYPHVQRQRFRDTSGITVAIGPYTVPLHINHGYDVCVGRALLLMEGVRGEISICMIAKSGKLTFGSTFRPQLSTEYSKIRHTNPGFWDCETCYMWYDDIVTHGVCFNASLPLTIMGINPGEISKAHSSSSSSSSSE